MEAQLMRTICVAALFAALPSAAKDISWTEDARLSDGPVVLVHRQDKYEIVTDVGQGFKSGWSRVRGSIWADLPVPTKRRVAWESSLEPIALDVIDGAAYFVGVAGGPAAIEFRLPYGEQQVAFRLSGDRWERIPVAEVPEAVRPNLFVSSYQYFLKDGKTSGVHLSLGRKYELDSSSEIGIMYRNIVRRPKSKKKAAPVSGLFNWIPAYRSLRSNRDDVRRIADWTG